MSGDVPTGDRPQFIDLPRPWLLARRGWKPVLVTLVLAGLGGACAWSNTLPAEAVDAGLSQGGARTLAIFLAAVVLWVTEAVPLVVTGLGVFVALVAGGIGSPAHQCRRSRSPAPN